MKSPMQAAVLVSGGGTNLQALIDFENSFTKNSCAGNSNAENSCCENSFAENAHAPYSPSENSRSENFRAPHLQNANARVENLQNANSLCPYHLALVLSDRKDAFALERAKKAGIQTALISAREALGENFKNFSRDEKRLAISNAALFLCQKNAIDAIVLAGFLTVLSGEIIKVYANKIVNLHPALLPKFGGEGMWGHHVHEAVLAAREKESGCTVHLVDAGCDTGRILVQKKVPVLAGDTPETLYARIAPLEHGALIEGVCELAKNF